MASSSGDSTFIVQMLEDFRTGGSSQRREKKIVSNLRSDGSEDVSDSAKRKLSLNDEQIGNDSIKYMKLDITSNPTTGTSERNNRSTSPPASPWENHRIRSQLLDAKMKMADMENQISRHHALREEMELLFKKERKSLQKRVESLTAMVKELESHLLVVRKRETDVKEELRQCKSSVYKDKMNLEERIQNLQQENAKLTDSLHEIEQKSQVQRTTSEQLIEQLKQEVSEREEQSNEIKKRNSELERRLRDELLIQTKFEQLNQELQHAQLRIKELEKERDEHIEAVGLVKSQQEKVLHYSELEKQLETSKQENKNLKKAIPKQLLLEEMVQDLKTRQAVSDEQGYELAWAQSRISHLETVLNEWYSVAQDYCDGYTSSSLPPDPAFIRKKINELQQRVHVLTADISEVKSQFNDTRQKKDLLTIELQGAKKEIEKLRSNGEQQNHRLRILQKKLLLVTMERDSYRSHFDSYEKDLTISSSSITNQQQQRIETMERILDGYHQMLEKIEMESDRTKGSIGNTEMVEKLYRLECERNTLLQEKEQLQKRKDELEVQLEYRAIKGDYNPVTSKVLHFRNNPASEAKAQYEDEVTKLRAKCSRLEERIKLLEEGNVHNITQKVEENVASSNPTEIEGLREIVSAQEIKMQRLKEVFHASAKEFREVCYELFGYQIDRNENMYKLCSMYAESPNDHLMFKRMPDGTIDMMETPYSSTLGELIDLHLHHHNSLPLFIGAVTVELYNRQTLPQGSQTMELSECV